MLLLYKLLLLLVKTYKDQIQRVNSHGKKPTQLHGVMFQCAVLSHFTQRFFRTLVNTQPKLCLYFIAILELHQLQPRYSASYTKCQGKRDRKTHSSERDLNAELGEHTGKKLCFLNCQMVKDFSKYVVSLWLMTCHGFFFN